MYVLAAIEEQEERDSLCSASDGSLPTHHSNPRLESELPHTFSDLCHKFTKTLKLLASKASNVIIILDGLDEVRNNLPSTPPAFLSS